jgi:hypothetical protein
LQASKHDEQRTSTWDGIIIRLRDDFENADDPIRFNNDCGSNEIDESDLQASKHDDPRIFTNLGTIISSNILK